MTSIVGIGASAGGVQALQMFFEALPDRTGVAYVVIVDFPAALEIQEIAIGAGVSYADQMGFALRLPVIQQVAAKQGNKPPA